MKHRAFAILVVGIAMRLVNLSAPLYDRQTWRQTDTAEIARNFYLHGMHLLYPQVGWGGPVGYCETEFPLFNYLVAGLYHLAGGPHDWLGRLAAVFFWAVAALLLWRLARRHMPENAALLSLAAYTFMPLGLFYTRTFQPESLLHALCLGALYSSDRWLAEGKARWYWLALLVLSLAVMVKLPVYLAFALAALAWAYRGRAALKSPALWVLAIVPIGAGAAWYRHAGHLAEIGSTFSLVGNKWASWAVLSDLSGFWLTMLGRIAGLTLGPFVFFMVIAALRNKPETKLDRAAHAYFWGVLAFTLVFAYGNVVHDYYQMPWLPPAALLAGGVWARLLEKRPRLGILLLLLFPAASFLTILPDYRPKTLAWNNQAVYDAGLALKRVTPPNSLVLVADGGTHLPEVFYFGERKGWHGSLGDVSAPWIDSFRRQGARYLVLTTDGAAAELDRFKLEREISRGTGFRIFALDPS